MQLNKELISAWDQEQRVKALKIVIQVGKAPGYFQCLVS
jgi:hypothetical protein